jgi:hypothetical protein
MIGKAQEQRFIRELIENMSESLPEDFDVSELEERLVWLQKHPIDLNRTTVDALKGLALMSPIQVTNLFQHIAINGELIDVLELQSIDGFDVLTIEKLIPFVTISPADLNDKITVNNLRKLGNHDLLMRLASLAETPKGFTHLEGSSYTGTKVRLLLKYKFHFSNRVAIALTMEKDAGERLLSTKTKLPDFLAGHLALNKLGKIEKLIIGDYVLQFGQGLTLWSGFTFGKGPDVASVVKKDDGLKAYSAANEYNFQRGIAAKINLNERLCLTSFLSHRNLSAAIDLINDEQVVSTINETGLHRTANEIKGQGALKQNMYGMALQLQTNHFSAGTIAYQTNFNKRFVAGDQLYKYFRFTGHSLTNVGIYYNTTYQNFYFFGEAGSGSTGGIAYLNGALISLSPKASMVLIHRNYQSNYHNFYNQALAESTEASNEKGFYVGLNLNPLKAWTISCYVDYFRFPWLKFLVDAPSMGHELFAQVLYRPSKQLNMMLRVKIEDKEQNTSDPSSIHFIDPVKKGSYRGDVNWQLNKKIKFQHRMEISQFKQGARQSEFGYLIYQDIAYHVPLKKLAGNIRIAHFHTPSYDSRIYAYEDDVLYNFSLGMYNGKGFRTYFNLKYKLLKKLDAWARFAMFFYPNAQAIGTGLDEIGGNKKTDLKFQLRYQF